MCTVPSAPGRPVSEYGSLCHAEGSHGWGGRCRRAFMVTIRIEHMEGYPNHISLGRDS